MTECARFQRVVLCGANYDPTLAFVGSTPYPGDLNSTGVLIPEKPTVGSGVRYLGRLCGLRLAPNQRCIIRSIRQLLTIGADLSTADPNITVPVELPVSSPTWRFIDGAVSWHLREVDSVYAAGSGFRFNDTAPPLPPYSEGNPGFNAAVLMRALVAPDGTGYVPLNGGVPYGVDIAGLGDMRAMHWPWNGQYASNDLGVEILGPRDLVLYASVYQTDPETRPLITAPTTAMGPEDKFITTYPNARYWRVGAEMVVDICNPLAEDAT
jgi:hypothetical protein